MADQGDQRREPRYPLLLRVDHPDGTPLHDVTENLSATGLFIRTDRALAPGTRLPLLLGFPGLLEPLEVEVEVVWTRAATDGSPAGVAVKIPADCPDDHVRLAAIVRGANRPARAARVFQILVVEDNPAIEALYEGALKRLQEPGGDLELSVDYARDGFEALTRLQARRKVDLIITDLFMPVMDGFQLVQRIRADATIAPTPIIAISAGGADAQERAMAAGVDVFLKKPVKIGDILGTVRALLRLG